MAVQSLYDRYDEMLKKMEHYANKMEDEAPVLDMIKENLFMILTVRAVNILNEMEAANASTIANGLLELHPDRVQTREDLIQGLVHYHTNEKQAIRKFKSKTKKEIKQIPIERMYELIMERTMNYAYNNA